MRQQTTHWSEKECTEKNRGLVGYNNESKCPFVGRGDAVSLKVTNSVYFCSI